jgi:hypothetical protein
MPFKKFFLIDKTPMNSFLFFAIFMEVLNRHCIMKSLRFFFIFPRNSAVIKVALIEELTEGLNSHKSTALFGFSKIIFNYFRRSLTSHSHDTPLTEKKAIQGLLGHALSTVASIIVALHAIILHPHAETLTADAHLEIHRKSNSFIGLISFLFHESEDTTLDTLTYAEYKNEKKSKAENAKWVPYIFDKPNPKIDTHLNKKALCIQTRDLVSFYGMPSYGLRGPPVI